MKTSVMIAGVCCLLALSFTLSECDEHINCTSIDSDLQNCIDEYRANPNNTDVVCEGNCRSVLEEYADDCLGTGAEGFKDALDEACNNGTTAINCETPTSELGQCIDDYRDNPGNGCGDCKSALEEYADDCLGTGAEAYRNALDEACNKRSNNNCETPTSELAQCIDDYTANPKNGCGDCRSTLEEYGDACPGGEGIKDALDETCNKRSNNNCETPTSELVQCIDDFTADPENVCGDCRSTLEEYGDACPGGEGIKDALNEACDFSEDGAGSTVEAAALSTILSALVLAMAAVFN